MSRTIENPVVVAGADEGSPHQLAFLLHRMMSVLVEASSPRFRLHGLSIPAAHALIVLYEEQKQMTVSNLAGMTSTDLSTMSRILQRLEGQGLLTRVRLDEDHRVVHAVLTRQGRAVARTCRNASLEHEAILLCGVSEYEAALLKRLLIRVHGNARFGLAG